MVSDVVGKENGFLRVLTDPCSFSLFLGFVSRRNGSWRITFLGNGCLFEHSG